MIDTRYTGVLRWLLMKQGYPPLPNPDDRRALSIYTWEGCRKGGENIYCYGISHILVEPRRIYVIMLRNDAKTKPKFLLDVRLAAMRSLEFIYRKVLIDDRGVSLYHDPIDVNGDIVSISGKEYRAVKAEKIMGIHVLYFDHSIYPYTIIDAEEAEVGDGRYEIFGLSLERREDEQPPTPWRIMETAAWEYATWVLAQRRISLDRGVIEGCHNAEAIKRYLEAHGISTEVDKRGSRCVLPYVHSEKIAGTVDNAVKRAMEQMRNTRTDFVERFGSYIIEARRAAPVRAAIPIEVEFAPGVKRRYMYEYETWPVFYADERTELVIRGHEGTVKVKFREPGTYVIQRSHRERVPIYNKFAIERGLRLKKL